MLIREQEGGSSEPNEPPLDPPLCIDEIHLDLSLGGDKMWQDITKVEKRTIKYGVEKSNAACKFTCNAVYTTSGTYHSTIVHSVI